MNVAILGDLFINNEILQTELMRAFAGAGVKFEYTFLSDSWPLAPRKKSEEISGFVGDEEDTRKAVHEAEIILTHTAPITRRVLAAASNLKIVGAACSSPVNIDWKACTERGIPVLYAPDRDIVAVAEFTVGLMMAQSRNISRSHKSMMAEKRWREDLYLNEIVGMELGSSVIGLIGFDAIGSKVAALLQAFGARELVFDPSVPIERIQEAGCEAVDLDTLLKEADFISLHCRLTKETRGLLGEREIRLMKPYAYLINTAHGELIDHDALYRALAGKQILGAALDVFEAEPPPPNSLLYTLENVTATSRLAGASIQAAENGARVLCAGVYDYIVNKNPPRYCANPDYIKYLSG